MKILTAFALPEESVEIRISGFEIQTVITRISKPYAAATLAHAVATLHPDAVINVGSAGTQHFSVGDILVCRRFIDRDIARQSFDSISSELCFEDDFPVRLHSLVGGAEADKYFTVNTGASVRPLKR